jgi:hypothetical protein
MVLIEKKMKKKKEMEDIDKRNWYVFCVIFFLFYFKFRIDNSEKNKY